jgi:hypothetical protein
MMRFLFSTAVVLSLFLSSGVAYGGASDASDDKLLSGMSIVGNDEAPKSLVIVPWKSSELGDTLEVSRALDSGRGPVDRDVFQRGLDYYGIRSGWEEKNGATSAAEK